MSSLKAKTVSGIKWQLLAKIAQKVISVGTFAVLARILEPSAFGLFAMAFIAIDGLHYFNGLGLDSALIQRRDRVEEAARTAHWMVLGMGFLMAGICWLLAPLAAAFFQSGEVLSVIRALAVIFICSSFSKIPYAMLTREMRFGTISAIELAAALINAVFAVTFALISPTVWALVWAYVIKQIAMAVMCNKTEDQRPKTKVFSLWSMVCGPFRTFDRSLARELLSYGRFACGANFLSYLSANIRNIITGRILGAASLGFWTLAGNIGNAVSAQFSPVFSNVLFPAYSKLQADREDLRRAFIKTVKYISMISVPLSLGMIFLAKPLVLVIYGPKWLAIVPVMQIFGIVQLFAPLMSAAESLFSGIGRPDLNFKISGVSLCLDIFFGTLFTVKWGIVGLAWWAVASVVLFAPVYVFFIVRLVHIKRKVVREEFTGKWIVRTPSHRVAVSPIHDGELI